MGEIWKDIKNYEGFYKISSTGKIKSLIRRSRNSENIKATKIDSTGYRIVILTKNKKHTTLRLHRLLALNFIENPQNKACVNHKNGIKLDNSLDNLEWCTKGENNIHAYATGLRKAPLGRRYNKQCKSIVCFDMNNNELAIFKTANIAARLLKLNRPKIHRVLKGELASLDGYVFKYAE